MWLHQEIIARVISTARSLYPVVSYAWASVPTYPSGTIGFMMSSLDPTMDFKTPRSDDRVRALESVGTRYYDAGMHRGAFFLPRFIREKVEGAIKEGEAKSKAEKA